MPTPIITAALALALTLLFVVLSFRVSLLRQKLATPFGDGNNDTLLRAIRAHGNLGESAPLMLILLLTLEIVAPASQAIWAMPIWAIASIYFAGRLLAAIASFLDNGRGDFARPITMLTTLLSLLAASIMLGRAIF